ncbi:MAG: sulfite exporter TauE/SafE family protein [Eubacteriales bacterium]
MDIVFIIAVFAAFVVKGITGFGNTLVFASITSFSEYTINITPVDLIVGLPSNAVIAIKERKSISLKVVLPLALLVILGTIPGVYILKNADANLLKVIFGFVVVLVGVETLLRERRKRTSRPSKLLLGIIGIVSGILCGMFGIGAFLVAYISRTTENTSQFRGNICTVFLAENIFRLIIYSVKGIINVPILITSIKMLPFMLAGLFFGILLSKKMNEKSIKKIIVLLLIITGFVLIINNLRIY